MPIAKAVSIVVLASIMWSGVPTANGQIASYRSDVDAWKYSANGNRAYAFDSYYPGVDGKADLTGSNVSIDLEITQLTIQRHDAGGALRDASIPFGWVSDAPLYATSGPGCTWTFSEPIYGMYVYFGSLSIASDAAMKLYSQGEYVGIVTRHGGSLDGVFAVGMGFTSQTPIDQIEFFKAGVGDAVLVGAYVGIQEGEPSLGTIRIPGYQGPRGEEVDLDFAITTQRPNPFKLSTGDLVAGQTGTFTVVGGSASKRTYLLYSLTGRGSVRIGQLGVTVGISQPILAASKNTNAQGGATWSLPIPQNSRGRDVWFQCAQPGNVSTIAETWIR